MAATLGSGERWTEGIRSWPERGTGQGQLKSGMGLLTAPEGAEILGLR